MNKLQGFTNLYSLSKTLRFELIPIDENGIAVIDITTFLSNILEKDEKVKAAYQTLKPVLDNIHEQIINDSLNSTAAKDIDFSAYFEEYRKGKEKKLDKFESILRESIGKTFEETITEFNKRFSKKNKKGNFKPLFEIKKNVPIAKAEILDYIKEQYADDIELQHHVEEVLFTYFSHYNTNRSNYYEYKKEANTAIASRIVSDNLPKFCDNILMFEKRQNDYEDAYQFLKNHNKETQIKDAESGEMIETLAINKDLFTIKHFNKCLTRDEIETYNKLVGHYNLLINLYNLARKDEKDFSKLKQFKTLYKQIGCGKGKVLFFAINNDEELKKLLCKIKTNSQAFIINVNSFIAWLQEHKQNNDWDGIYWSKAAVDKISNKYLDNWHSLKDELKKNKVCVHKHSTTKELEFNDVVELSELFSVKFELKEDFTEKNIIDVICDNIKENLTVFGEKIESVSAITDYQNDNNKNEIDKCLRLISENVIHSIKYFSVKEKKVKGEPINPELSNFLSLLLRNDNFDIKTWYEAIHGYLTKKPQDDVKKQKLKLNFEKGNLLNGFVDSHTDNDNGTQYGGYIFRKKNANNEYEYFLGISKDAKLFRCHKKKDIKTEDESPYERLDYYQAKNTTYFDDKYIDNKEVLINKIDELIDKVIGNKKEKEKIKKIMKNGEITPTSLFDKLEKSKIKDFKDILRDNGLNDLATNTIGNLQEYCKKFENNSNKLKEIVKDKSKYIGIKGLKQIISDLQDIAKENKIYDFFNIDKHELKKSFEQNNKLYLFKIKNKDLKERDLNYTRKDYKGKKMNYNDNLHTLYFKALMREIANARIDIGKGEIFFRSAINEPQEITHPKNTPIFRRSDQKEESKFTHDIIKDNRFYKDQLQLHLSISINYNPTNEKVEDVVNDFFIQQDDILFLGIDRGERNLIYYSLVNHKGEILEQGDFNEINGKDYYSAIVEKTKDKKKAQQNLGKAVEIKNIKDGYISLVVHEIMNKIRNKPTFIVLEYLNKGFKKSRFFREQQVYQKFELAIAKKLNYLVYKDAKPDEIGSAINGLQLTPPVNNYENDIEHKKQLGIMLYVRANHTSVTDPVTGWRKNIHLQKGSEKNIKDQIMSKFSEIGFDGQDYFFEYIDKNVNKQWRLWSSKDGKSLERYRSRRGKDKNEFIVDAFDIKDILDRLFHGFDKTKSLKEQLQSKNPVKIGDHTAWESLRFVIDLIMQIRNNGDTSKKQDDNFLLSPIRSESNNEHFDSRNYRSQSNHKLPVDADANGAFNIARKGIIMNAHIEQWIKDGKKIIKNDDKEESDLELFISDEEWDMWLLDRKKWDDLLSVFASKSGIAKQENNENTDKATKPKRKRK